MPSDIEELSKKIARSHYVDGYSMWRTLKNINNEIASRERHKLAIPIELVRLRAALIKARLYRGEGGQRDGAQSVSYHRSEDPIAVDIFDAFNFIDHYRTLGGRRQATAFGDLIEINQRNGDTHEAAEFWAKKFPPLTALQRREIAWCLLVRGYY
jgi:hypothetical protein